MCDVNVGKPDKILIMSEVCSKCGTACFFKDVTKSKDIKDLFGCPCDMCRRTLCRNCSGLSSSEIRVLTAQSRIITYYCPECVETIRISVGNLPAVIEKINNIEKRLNVLEKPHNDDLNIIPALNDGTNGPIEEQFSKGDFVALTNDLKSILDSQSELIGSQLNTVVNNIKDANKELVRLLVQENITPKQHRFGIDQVSEAVDRAVAAHGSNIGRGSSRLLSANQSIKGSNKGTLGLSAAVKQSWFYVGNLSGNTTVDQLRGHLASNKISFQVTEKLLSRNEHVASFKVSVDPVCESPMLDPDLWPEGTTVKPFVFKSRTSRSTNNRHFLRKNRNQNNPSNHPQN